MEYKGGFIMTIKKTQQVQPMQVRAGMTVNDVRQHGSEAQKLAASLFDSDRVKNDKGEFIVKDGIFNENEAKRFNEFEFTLKDNIFTMRDKRNNQSIAIKYDNVEDLKEMLNENLSEVSSNGGMLSLFNFKKGLRLGTAGTIQGYFAIDITKKSIDIDGVRGDIVATSGAKLTVKDSDLETVSTSAKELEVKNTKDKGVIYDSATEIHAQKDTRIKADKESKIKIKRD